MFPYPDQTVVIVGTEMWYELIRQGHIAVVEENRKAVLRLSTGELYDGVIVYRSDFVTGPWAYAIRNEAAMIEGDICPKCGGTGEKARRTYIIGIADVVELCSDCDGTGRLPRCGICLAPLQHVRPGKWQCVGEHGDKLQHES